MLPEEARLADETPLPARDELWRKRLAHEEITERRYRRTQALRRGNGRPYDEGLFIDLVLKSVGLWKRGRRNAATPVLRKQEMCSANLPPAFDGFSLLHLSDLHFTDGFEWIEPLADLIGPLEPDVCVLTGDYRYLHGGSCDRAVEGMQRLLPSIRASNGIYAVLGNHDSSTLVEPYRALGIRWLLNTNTRIQRNGQCIYLAGVDDNHAYRTDCLPLAVEGIPDGLFRILLAHSPAIALEAARLGIDVCLCGHTHAGQIRLPFVGGLVYNCPAAPRHVCAGHWQMGATQGYTSAGIGSTASPVRFNCPPEAALIRLRTLATP